MDRYQRDIARGLSDAFAAAEVVALDGDDVRLVVFSDHHRGTRDGADDFRRCEPAYAAALGYYLETGHRLYLLGDGEELWECGPREVLVAHRPTLELEAAFHAAGRFERFWGNHDDRWRYPDEVASHLHPLFPGLRLREALRLRIGGGELFLVHGHQGTMGSDRWSWLSRLFVRHLWRPLQRRLDFASTSPSRDWDLRERHDTAMFTWARAHPARPVLIAGHTHRPVFWTSRAPVKAATPTGDSAPQRRAAQEYARAEARRVAAAAHPVDPPCYFNTGCCSFGDGDVTGIEVADGEIRLVRWPAEDGRPEPKLLARAPLAEVFAAVAAYPANR